MDGWGTFMMTGQIKDYLAYKQEEKKCNGSSPVTNQTGEKNGESIYAAECYSYRDGASGNTNW